VSEIKKKSKLNLNLKLNIKYLKKYFFLKVLKLLPILIFFFLILDTFLKKSFLVSVSAISCTGCLQSAMAWVITYSMIATLRVFFYKKYFIPKLVRSQFRVGLLKFCGSRPAGLGGRLSQIII
jgi:membrane protein CcdC involved in cytochrome C biogenesis